MYTGIDKQLVKKEKIKTKPTDISFKVFNIDSIKNKEVIRIIPLKVEINRYKKQIYVAVMDLNGTDMFLGHDWLVRHNLEVNWKEGTIQFTRCPRLYRISYQDIIFKTKQVQTIENQDNKQQKIDKKPDPTNLEDLTEYI